MGAKLVSPGCTRLTCEGLGTLHSALCTSSGKSDRSVKLVSPVCARLTCEVSQRRDSACFLGPDIGHNFGQGRVFRVRTKPSKQPLGLVARGVPIEKVRAKRAMHLDWAH